MSGSFAIPHIVKNTENVSGAILVAPTGVKDVSLSEWKRVADDMHIMFVYGEDDDLIGAPAAEYLKKIDDIQVRGGVNAHPTSLNRSYDTDIQCTGCHRVGTSP